MIFCIMGRIVYIRLLKRDKTLNQIIIYTTKPKRDEETNNVQYNFVNEDFLIENKNKIIKKEFITQFMEIGTMKPLMMVKFCQIKNI